MRPDPIALVEAAYLHQKDAKTWLTEILRAAAPLIDTGLGCFGLVADLADPTRVEILERVSMGCDPKLADFISVATKQLSASDQAMTYRSPKLFAPMSERLGGSQNYERHWIRGEFQKRDWADFDSLFAFDAGGVGCAFAAQRADIRKPTRRQVAMWSRLAAHLTAGLRLQRALGSKRGSTIDSPDVQAVVEPSGKVQHAEGGAEHALDRLRQAALAIDRARSSLRRTDPGEALSIWRGLVSGRWSLVEVFDSDRRRFMIARCNEPQPRAPLLLSLRERQVVAYVAQGYSNRLIAYHLGLAESTVAEHVGRAMIKLGVRSRIDLARAFGLEK